MYPFNKKSKQKILSYFLKDLSHHFEKKKNVKTNKYFGLQVCGQPGAPCSTLCGGGGCGRCGGDGCDGAITISQTAFSFTQQAEELISAKAKYTTEAIIPEVVVLIDSDLHQLSYFVCQVTSKHSFFFYFI